jgi:Zn-dependent M32 family carboxypeptidase
VVSTKQLLWRRGKVSELLVKGHTQYEIASVLKVSQPTINNDVQFLRNQARTNLQTHLNDRLPGEFENCMSGINQVLKMCWEIATKSSDRNNSDKILSSTIDEKTRLQALALANDCYRYKMDLVTNSIVITDALKFVQQKKKELTRIGNCGQSSIPEENSYSSYQNDKPNNNNATNKVF